MSDVHSVEVVAPVNTSTDELLQNIYREIILIRQHLQGVRGRAPASGVVGGGGAIARNRAVRPAGIRWTDEEVSGLLEEVKAGKDWAEIAVAHGRTDGAVKMRLGQYMGWRNRMGDSWELLADSISKTVEDVQGLVHSANERRDRPG